MTLSRRLVIGAVIGCIASSLPTTVAAQVAQMAGVRAQVPFALGRFELTTRGSMDRIASPVGVRTPFTFDAALSLPITSGGLWVGSGLEGAPEVDSTPVRALFRGGYWQTVRGIRVSIDAASHIARLGGRAARTWQGLKPGSSSDSGTFGDSAKSTLELWSDVEGRVAWRSGRATFDAVVGGRPRVLGLQPTLWTRIGVGYALTNRFSLAAAAGNDPPRFALGVPGTRFASLALRVNPWGAPKSEAVAERPTTFALKPAGSGSYRVTYLAANASSVEFSGDFDKWRPVSLVQTRPGVWEATIAMAPGTYHVNVRVNGERWIAPPGLPQAEDNFNGTVGVLVVR